jgi:uncharacterized protein with HEPN domain
MFEKDKANLMAILDSIQKIQTYINDIWNANDLFANEKTFDAVLMNFINIGESVNRLSDSIIEEENHIPWAKVIGFRNLVAHDYFGVDAEEVWQIIQDDLPKLLIDIENLVNQY